MTRQIQIRIFPDGKIRTETKNIKGKACLKYIEPMEKLLAARAVDSAFTDAYYETQEQLAQQEGIENEQK